jgi:3-deoxy-D-manno-octulosonate 8-phosphate phosphatase (KDO 8-P phosphatase)
VIDKAHSIKLLILDVDGVLTDGKIYMTSTGEEFRAFHVHDGMGITRLLKAGIEVAIISSRENPLVVHRMKELGVTRIFQGQKNKLTAYDALLSALKLTNDAVAYVGDDLADIPVMQRAGIAIAVANAVDAVKQVADWQSTRCGGEGAVREICDMILSSSQHE